MKATIIVAAVVLMAAGLVGCNRAGTGGGTTTGVRSSTTERTTTTTTQTAPPANDRTATGRADVDVQRDRTTAPLAGPTDGGVNVDVTPGGGVDVDVQGQPIRERLRERRAARDTAPLPR